MKREKKKISLSFTVFSVDEMFLVSFFVLKLKKFIDCKSWALVCLFFSEFENELISNDHHHYIRWKKPIEKNKWMNESFNHKTSQSKREKTKSTIEKSWCWLVVVKFCFCFVCGRFFLVCLKVKTAIFFGYIFLILIRWWLVGWLLQFLIKQR